MPDLNRKAKAEGCCPTLRKDPRGCCRAARSAWAAALAVVLLAAAPAAEAEWVWHQDAGWVNTREAPEPGPEGAFRHAVGLLMQGNVNSALERLERTDSPDLAPELRRKVRFHLAEAHLRLGAFRKADAVRRALWREGLPPEWRERVLRLHLALGRAWAEQAPRDGVQALRALRALAAGEPLLAEVLVELGDAEIRAGLYDAARESYLRALEADPSPALSGRAVYGAGWADLLYCRDVAFLTARIRRALDRFEEYRERHPGGPLAEWAEEAAWVCQSLRHEYAEDRRQVFFAVTHLLGGDPEQARRPLRRGARRYRETYVGEAAQFYLGEYAYQKGELWSAFKAYERLMERYPGTMRVRKVVERQYDIGRRLMEAEGRWIWRGWILSRAIRSLDKSIDHNPSGPHADSAQLLVGDCYLEREMWDDAYAAYMALIENYPASQWVSTARFKAGMARFRQAEFTEDKTDLLLQARRAFEVYLRESPRGPFAAEARGLLRRVESREAALAWRSARFYERTDEAAAAAFVLRRIVQDHPDTAWAEAARKRLEEYAAQGLAE